MFTTKHRGDLPGGHPGQSLRAAGGGLRGLADGERGDLEAVHAVWVGLHQDAGVEMSLTLLVTLVLVSVVCLWVVGLGVFLKYWAREEAKTFARVKGSARPLSGDEPAYIDEQVALNAVYGTEDQAATSPLAPVPSAAQESSASNSALPPPAEET